MRNVNCEFNINCQSSDAWNVLSNFGLFLEWATDGKGSINVNGAGVGMTRELDIAGLGKTSERLDKIDNNTMTLSYSQLNSAVGGMTSYHAKVRIDSIDYYNCKLVWHGEFEPAIKADTQVIKIWLKEVYKNMSIALEHYVNNNSENVTQQLTP